MSFSKFMSSSVGVATSNHAIYKLTSRTFLRRRVEVASGTSSLHCSTRTVTASVRYHSQAAAANNVNVKSNTNTDANANSGNSYPELKHVPSYPFVGSFVSSLSGTPDTSLSDPYDYFTKMHDTYGDFYTMGMPGFGNKKDLHGTLHVLTDPREMVKVVRLSGSYPSGLTESLWVKKKWNETRGMHSRGMSGSGPEWKRLRSFLQKDLLHPDSARGYVGGMIQAAQIASKVAPSYKNDLNTYLAFCSFDLFSAITFGEMMKSVVPENNSNGDDPNNDNNVFARNVQEGLSLGILLSLDPIEILLGELGITTRRQEKCFKHFDMAWEIARRKIGLFMDRRERGILSESEMNSHLNRALDRQLEEGSDVTTREVQELAFSGLFAAIDTTKSYLGWNLFHIARTPRVQQKLYDELSHAVKTIGNGVLTPEVLEKAHSPYLYAIVRESHRLTPLSPVLVQKRLDKDVDICGVPMRAGEVFALEAYTQAMDPNLHENPEEFIPERWLDDAVASRKGTPLEIVDHPFLKEPFSQGARRCPGSRVAMNETHVMLAQLVLDWNMTSAKKDLRDVTWSKKTTIELEIPSFEFMAR